MGAESPSSARRLRKGVCGALCASAGRIEARPVAAASPAARRASKRSGPPNRKITNAKPYHSQPSPPRVAQTIQKRTHRGARQLFRRRIKR